MASSKKSAKKRTYGRDLKNKGAKGVFTQVYHYQWDWPAHKLKDLDLEGFDLLYFQQKLKGDLRIDDAWFDALYRKSEFESKYKDVAAMISSSNNVDRDYVVVIQATFNKKPTQGASSLKFTLTPESAESAVRKTVIKYLKVRIDYSKDILEASRRSHHRWFHYAKEEQPVIYFIAGLAAWAWIPPLKIWSGAAKAIDTAEKSLKNGDLEGAKYYIEKFYQEYNTAEDRWKKYREKNIAGAERGQKIVEVVNDVAFEAAADCIHYLSGGTMPRNGLKAALAFVNQGIQHLSGRAYGMEQDYNLQTYLARSQKDAAAALLGSIMGDALTKPFKAASKAYFSGYLFKKDEMIKELARYPHLSNRLAEMSNFLADYLFEHIVEATVRVSTEYAFNQLDPAASNDDKDLIKLVVKHYYESLPWSVLKGGVSAGAAKLKGKAGVH